MYILVRQTDNIIIGTASRLVDEKSAADKGYNVYEIADSEFKASMLGSKLAGFDKG
jgi:hypothetical protein